MAASDFAPVAVVRELLRPAMGPLRSGVDFLRFCGRATVATVPAMRHPAQIISQVNDIAVGRGALVIGGGAIVVMITLTGVLGIQVGLEGTEGLELIGAEALVGFVSAFANVREIAPLGAGLIFASQIGAQFTAQLGGQRISEEIDALEVMGTDSLRFLVSTRLIASYLVVMPLFAIGLWMQLATTRLTAVWLFGVSPGIYDQYFEMYLPRFDVLAAVLKVLIFITIVTFIHCYYGFYARGGPEEVGRQVGRAVRLSVTAIFVTNFLLSLVLFADTSSVRFSG
jgi:phospholipid/cholesterol/gamma-HCH transport system permease protein